MAETQLKSKKPAAFYSGEKSPSEDEISDVQMWNKKHGTMWIIYGITIILAWICGSIIGDSVFILIPYLSGLMLSVFVMIGYHHKPIKMYKKKRQIVCKTCVDFITSGQWEFIERNTKWVLTFLKNYNIIIRDNI